jgi:arylsulfatase A-like enzyme
VRAYLAANSFVDHLVGMVLEGLQASGADDNTVIVLWSDHGFHLGEKLRWAKRTLWEETTRVPLIVAGPGITVDARCSRPVGLIDIYPTLLDYCGLPEKADLEGVALRKLLENPDATWTRPALCTFGPNNHSLRSEHWRYTRYADGSEELYDHRADPNEWDNLAVGEGRPSAEHQKVIAELSQSLPQRNVDPLPGSAGSDSPLYGEGGKTPLNETMKRAQKRKKQPQR